jgi:hypothetical protein
MRTESGRGPREAVRRKTTLHHPTGLVRPPLFAFGRVLRRGGRPCVCECSYVIDTRTHTRKIYSSSAPEPWFLYEQSGVDVGSLGLVRLTTFR